jgi:hypothetical protein
MIVRNGPKRPRYPLALIHPLGPLFRHLPLSLRRHLLYFRAMGRWGNFRSPRLSGEKAQWRIINDRRPLLAFVEDKLASKEYVKRALAHAGLSDQIRSPETYWVGTDLRDLMAITAQLPTRWVLKPNHSSGRYILIDSSTTPVDWESITAISARWLERDEEERVLGHWAYSQARHLLIVEERVGVASEPGIGPLELKVLNLDGKAQYFFLEDRLNYHGYYDCHLPDGTRFLWGEGDDPSQHYQEISEEVRLLLLQAAGAISAPFDEIRTDFFFSGGRLWCSELAAYETSGLSRTTNDVDVWLGAKWQLPDLTAPDPREPEWRTLLEGTPEGTLQR